MKTVPCDLNATVLPSGDHWRAASRCEGVPDTRLTTPDDMSLMKTPVVELKATLLLSGDQTAPAEFLLTRVVLPVARSVT